MLIKFPKEHSEILKKYNITKEFNKNKSFLLSLDNIPNLIYGISDKYWFLAHGKNGLYSFEDSLNKIETLSLNEIYKHLKDIQYDFIIGNLEIRDGKYLAKHPISGKMTEWKNEKEYIEFVVKSEKRCPEAEPIIAKNPEASFSYAKYVLHGRFELGEVAISTSADYSYEYAMEVIKSRFLLGEPVIAHVPFYSYMYAAFILHGRFELGEPAIAKESHHSYMYAMTVIKERFLLGENIMKTDKKVWNDYCDKFNVITKEFIDVMNIQFPKEHSSILDEYNITKEFNKNKSFLLELDNIPDLIYGINEDKYWFLAEGKGGLYEFEDSKENKQTVSLNELSKLIGLLKYDFIIGEEKNKSFLIQHPISGKLVDFGTEKDYNNKIRQIAQEAFNTIKISGKNDKLEKLISLDAENSYYYACYIGHPFKLGEPAIAKSALQSYCYALDVLHGRFELGEKTISQSSNYSLQYARDIIKGRWEPGEAIIVKEGFWSHNYDYALDVLHGRFELGEPNIAQVSKYSYYYAVNVLKGRFPLGEKVISEGEFAYDYVRDIIKGRWELAENKFANTSLESYEYALNFLHGRFPLGEPAIAKDAKWSYHYAKNVIKGRFELGEPYILGSPKYSMKYAKEVIKGRWPLAEATIAKEEESSLAYAKEVLHGRFPLGENIISYSDKYSLAYAKEVLHGRFEKGEVAIARDIRGSYLYAKEVLQDRFELGERAISFDIMNSYLYARDIIKGRFELAEDTIIKNAEYWKKYLGLLSDSDKQIVMNHYSKSV